jgi:hypothetical protein
MNHMYQYIMNNIILAIVKMIFNSRDHSEMKYVGTANVFKGHNSTNTTNYHQSTWPVFCYNK